MTVLPEDSTRSFRDSYSFGSPSVSAYYGQDTRLQVRGTEMTVS